MLKQNKYFFCLLILLNLSRLGALELHTSLNISNLAFDSDMNSSSMGILWGSSIIAEQKLNDTFLFSGGVVADGISGNRLESRLIYTSKYINIGMGPALASFNSKQIQLKLALSGFLTIKKDGKFNFTTEIYSTLGNLADRANDYSQLETSIALALNIPGAICTFSVETRQFTNFSIDSYSINSRTTDKLTNYKLEADLYKKNIPFNLIITFGYKNYERYFPANDATGRTIMGIGSAFVGAGTRVNIGKNIILNAGIDSGLYNFTLSNELAPDDLPSYLFNIHTTITYKF